MSQKVFKKTSRDKTIGVYMGQRDFVDRCDSVDPVDGVVWVDQKALQGKKVIATLSCTFKYGRDDQEVLGINFKRDIFVSNRQVFPPLEDIDRATHTDMQKKLIKKLGDNAMPFFFEFPDNLPCSVAIQPGPQDTGKKCAVEFEVRAYCPDLPDEKAIKKSTVKLAVRKIQYAPEDKQVIPTADSTFEFLLSDKPLQIKATLDKGLYYHGDAITVNVDIRNSSSRTIKNIAVAVEQITNVVLYSNDSYVKTVAIEEFSDTVAAQAKWEKTVTLIPTLARLEVKKGIAVDGKLRHDDTNLASSSIVKADVLNEVLGMMVQYRVVVKATGSALMQSSDVQVDLPFKLMNPHPSLAVAGGEDVVIEDFKRVAIKGAGDEDGGDGSDAEG